MTPTTPTPLTLGRHAETGQTITWGTDVTEHAIQIDGEAGVGRSRLCIDLLAEATALGLQAVVITSAARAELYRHPVVTEDRVDLAAVVGRLPASETLIVIDGVEITALPDDPRTRVAVVGGDAVDGAAYLVMGTGLADSAIQSRCGSSIRGVFEATYAVIWLEPRRDDMDDIGVLVSGRRALPLTTPHYRRKDAA